MLLRLQKASLQYQPHKIFASQWLAVVVGLLISGTLLAVDTYHEREAALASERDRLLVASTVVQMSVKESLEQSDKVMLVLRQEILESGIDSKLNLRLQTLAEAMPLIRSINVHDVSGTIVATS